MPGIFICYRHEDSFAYAMNLYERLCKRFGDASVFMDIKKLVGGDTYWEIIKSKIAASDVFVAVIGQQWLKSSPDWVMKEIAEAIHCRLRIIPTLVGAAQMPDRQDLPDALAPFAGRHAVEISDRSFDYGVDQLIEAVKKAFEDEIPIEHRSLDESWIAHYQLGGKLAKDNDLDGAVREYRECIRLKPNEAAGHFYLGRALYMKNDVDGAIGAFRECIRLRPGDAQAHHDLGLALEKKGKQKAAAHEEYCHASALQPNNTDYSRDCKRTRP